MIKAMLAMVLFWTMPFEACNVEGLSGTEKILAKSYNKARQVNRKNGKILTIDKVIAALGRGFEKFGDKIELDYDGETDEPFISLFIEDGMYAFIDISGVPDNEVHRGVLIDYFKALQSKGICK